MRTLAPRLTVSAAATQTLDGAIELRVRCRRTCRARATGRLLGRALKPVSRALTGGRTRTLVLELPAALRRTAGDSAKARLTVVATADSLSTRKVRVVTLRR